MTAAVDPTQPSKLRPNFVRFHDAPAELTLIAPFPVLRSARVLAFGRMLHCAVHVLRVYRPAYEMRRAFAMGTQASTRLLCA